ncbi:hypothetical protein SAMN05216286_1207 [Kosakonia oryzae]|uniref:Uncharacterized protein n=1 Tax=Kosakonia oryzae TaxID=497725 RepID=A0AA94KP02_9ENTR|nr:hypothetical protein SAMN05216286_1207 [Kosakonia oryzae]
MNIYQTFICRSRNNQKSFRLITSFEGYASDRRHENRLSVDAVDEIRSFFVPPSSIQTNPQRNKLLAHVAIEV